MPIHVVTADHEGEILGWTNSPQAAVKLSVLEVYTEPSTRPKPRYKTRTDYRVGQQIPLVLDRERIALINVEDFLI